MDAWSRRQSPQNPDRVKPAVATTCCAEFDQSRGKFEMEWPSCGALPLASLFRGAPNQPLAAAWKHTRAHDDAHAHATAQRNELKTPARTYTTVTTKKAQSPAC